MRSLSDLRCFYVVVCLLTTVSTHIIVAEEPIADPTATSVEEDKPLLKPDPRMVTSHEKMKRPLKIKFEAGETIEEAIKKMGNEVDLKVEFEGLNPTVLKMAYSRDLKQDVLLDGERFDIALNKLSKATIGNSEEEYESLQPFASLDLRAIPTHEGILISNPLTRLMSPCQMHTVPYSVADLVGEDAHSALNIQTVIRTQVISYWLITGLPGPINGMLYNPLNGRTESTENNEEAMLIASRMSYMDSAQVLIIRAPRSVHVEIADLLESTRQSMQPPEEEPPAPKPSRTTY